MIKGRVGTENVMLLIDSGAMCTLVNVEVLKNQSVKVGPSSRRIRGVTGHTLNVLGEAWVPLTINDQSFDYNCVIVEGLGYDVILGYDLMKHKGYMLDFSKVETVAMNAHYNAELQLEKDIQIPGRSKSWVWVKPSRVPEKKQELLVQTEGWIKKGLYVEEAITTINNKDEVLICLINENIQAETLTRATSVAWVEGMEDEDISVKDLDSFRLGFTQEGVNGDINTTAEAGMKGQARVAAVLQASNISTLKPSQRDIISRLVNKNPDVFALDDEILPSTSLMKFKINTGDAAPIKQRAYRLPQYQRKPLGDLLRKLQREGIIRPSSSNWAAPILLVPKKVAGQYRLCVDYRRLNEVVKSDNYPLPRIDDLLDRLEGSRVFSTLDLKWGYHQCQIEETDIPKTAFICCEGLYEYTKMAMGLKNAPSCFQRLLETVFADMLGQGVLVYIDDLILFTRTEEEHEELLEKVFKRLLQAGLSLKPEKCYYFQAEIEYLGHVVSERGLFPLKANIRKILEYDPPTTVKQLRGFLGLTSYYRKFIRDFAKVAQPLTEMTGSKVPFQWSEKQQQAFEFLKEKLTSPPLLAYPQFDKDFILFTDASDRAIGCVLSQKVDGQEVVVAYGSRTLNKAERNYSTVEKECLAVVHFTQEYRHYLLGRRFQIVSDHRPLMWLKGLSNPTGRLGRWALKLSEFDYEITYRKGKLNMNADFLSRMGADVINELQVDDQGMASLTTSRLKSAQNKDELCKALIAYLRRQELPPIHSRLRERIPLEAPNYVLRGDGVLLYNGQGRRRKDKGMLEGGDPTIVLPEPLRADVLQMLHDHHTAGHLGFKKTLDKVRFRFFWERMYTDIKTYVQKCDSCHKVKTPPLRRCAPLSNHTRAKYPLDRVQVDIIGPIYPRTYSGMNNILVITDEFTKFTEALVLPDQKSETVAQALVVNFLLKYGIPRTIHSDQGRNFMSKLLKEVTQIFKIDRVTGTAYHPQSQGAVERCNRILKEMIMHYVQEDPRQWDRYIPFVTHAYNTSVSASTCYTPHYLFFGREACLPVDILLDRPAPKYRGADDYKAEIIEKMFLAHQMASRNSREAREKQKVQYDKRAKLRRFEVGDVVYITNEAVRSRRLKEGMSRKFAYPWLGPFKIVQKISEVNFKVKEEGGEKVVIVHVNRIKPQNGGDWDKNEGRGKCDKRKSRKVADQHEEESSDGDVFEDPESEEENQDSEVDNNYSEEDKDEANEGSSSEESEGERTEKGLFEGTESVKKNQGPEVDNEHFEEDNSDSDETLRGEKSEGVNNKKKKMGAVKKNQGPEVDNEHFEEDNTELDETLRGEKSGGVNNKKKKMGAVKKNQGPEVDNEYFEEDNTETDEILRGEKSEGVNNKKTKRGAVEGGDEGAIEEKGSVDTPAGLGPTVSWPCGVCRGAIYDSGPNATPSIKCTRCGYWVHQRCSRFKSIEKMRRSELRGYQCSACLKLMYRPVGEAAPPPQKIGPRQGCGQQQDEAGGPKTPLMKRNWCDPRSPANILPTRLRDTSKKEVNISEGIPKYYCRGIIHSGVYCAY